jgi:hypothetical protein
MCKFLSIFLIIFFVVRVEAFAQEQQYIVKVAPFSSKISNEFPPVFYLNGIVFCSNQSDNSMVKYKDDNSQLFKIFYVQKKHTRYGSPKILAKELNSGFNDGPATFNEKGTVVFYSRNNSIEKRLKNISDTLNKLGIYSAELINGKWENVSPFAYNNPNYSFGTPALTPNGDRIYFSSNMPGGMGGMDLYYCDKINGEWASPISLGPTVNTALNESFPFAQGDGKLFFASAGHAGLGGMDLFYSQQIDGEWMAPVGLGSAINSSADDFGLITDSKFESGYFSSNRMGTDDIFIFSSAPLEFENCEAMKVNKVCFTFYDEKYISNDTVPVRYLWNFGNGVIRIGKEVKHCFPGPGVYLVKLSIFDALTGDTITKQVEYLVELENLSQAYIKSDSIGVPGKAIPFEGVTSDLKGAMATKYFWDFGEGFMLGGQFIAKEFKRRGEYSVKLGLHFKTDSLGMLQKTCVVKKIIIN